LQKVLITGAGGFLGKYLKQGLLDAGYEIETIGLAGEDNDITCDLSKEVPELKNQYVAVVHAAGKAHSIPKTEAQKKAFWDVNLGGTENLLKALENSNNTPKTIVFISSVSVYGLDSGELIPETHPLNATDPYGQSKIKAEEVIAEWSQAKGVNYFNLRLPLLAGDNPPGNLGSMIHALKKGYYFRIGKGNAYKSIVLASDVAKFIPTLFGKTQSGAYNLTDGVHPTFAQIEDKMAREVGKQVKIKVADIFARIIAFKGDFIPKFPLKTRQYKKITSTLTFADDKARKEIGWTSRSFLETPLSV
jgi:nucleoside-diphosphate-sugar epimerase